MSRIILNYKILMCKALPLESPARSGSIAYDLMYCRTKSENSYYYEDHRLSSVGGSLSSVLGLALKLYSLLNMVSCCATVHALVLTDCARS